MYFGSGGFGGCSILGRVKGSSLGGSRVQDVWFDLCPVSFTGGVLGSHKVRDCICIFIYICVYIYICLFIHLLIYLLVDLYHIHM